MPSLDTVHLFCRIVEAGNLSAVAREQNQNPSQLSRQLQALEAELGVRLLERSTRHLHLTEAGRVYLGHARELLRQHNQALDELSELAGSPRGLLRISAPEHFGAYLLTPWLAEFQARYPELRYELWFSDERLDLGRHGLDLSIRTGFPSDSRGWYRAYGHYPRLLWATPAYLARHGRPSTPADLADHRVLMHSVMPTEEWHFRRDQERTSLHISPWSRCNTGSGLYQLTLAGLGIGRLSPWIVDDNLQNGSLVTLLADWELVSEHGEKPGFYAHYPERKPPYKTRLLLDFLGEKLAGPPFVFET